MGQSSSKAAKTASKLSASKTARIYPTRSPPAGSSRTNVQPARPTRQATIGPAVHSGTEAAESRNESIPDNASDPDLALNTRLRTLGPVQPNPTQSNSSIFNSSSDPSFPGIDAANPKTQFSSQFQASPSSPTQRIYPSSASNPAVSLLTARHRLAEAAEAEFAGVGRASSGGRSFLDVVTIRQILIMRERGTSSGDIERRLGLREGLIGRLGRRGVVGVSEL